MRGCERILFFYQMQKLNLCVANSIFYVADVQSEDAADEIKVKFLVAAYSPTVAYTFYTFSLLLILKLLKYIV